MSTDYSSNELDGTLTAQAIVELTEANVSPVGHGAEWEREVAFLRDSGDDAAFGAFQSEVGEVMDLSSVLA